MDHIVDCWFEPSCTVCPKRDIFGDIGILSRMQHEGLLYKAELNKKDMTRILPPLRSSGARAILHWLESG